jgi:3',5'-nucleoside bisphosphate phosphatase
MKVDLHVHTTYSDGDFSPAEAAAAAREAGLDAVAIVDHDECRGYLEVADADYGLKVLPGIELAARYEGEVHVLGLLIDCSNRGLIGHIEKTSELRLERAKSIIKKLAHAGLLISYEDVKESCGNGAVGRPHIAAALVRKGYVGNVKEAFSKYLSKHGEFYVPFDKVDIAGAAQLIIGAGGKPVLAHPGLINSGVFESVLPKLKGMGFWGLEAYHTAHSDGQCLIFENAARNHGLFVTSGSDFHGSAKPSVKIGQEHRGGTYLFESMSVLGIV